MVEWAMWLMPFSPFCHTPMFPDHMRDRPTHGHPFDAFMGYVSSASLFLRKGGCGRSEGRKGEGPGLVNICFAHVIPKDESQVHAVELRARADKGSSKDTILEQLHD